MCDRCGESTINVHISASFFTGVLALLYTVKPVLVATSIKQATCIKQACIQIPKQANTLKCTCIKQAPVLSKHILIVPKVLALYRLDCTANVLGPFFPLLLSVRTRLLLFSCALIRKFNVRSPAFSLSFLDTVFLQFL